MARCLVWKESEAIGASICSVKQRCFSGADIATGGCVEKLTAELFVRDPPSRHSKTAQSQDGDIGT
ncbi:hypothetical protein Pan97_16810 [Bremerella volcania]|uniref:Uncharacterized protein n=1 Tax=Bremerella volcania TaxID=2527984 RepID=A0A518C620_9BACT|nr:hypothetical protein [Bremerella volcania]QDU74669.1 hypothetical protein Pan97_16810 [Bremerella volcania]